MRVLGTTASGVANETIPGAPQSFTATAASSTQINLSWSAPASNGGAAITSYTLKRGGTTIYTGPNTSFNNTGLSFATGYSYTVLATNSVGDGPTASASAVTLVNVPSAPTSFSASAVSSTQINLSWGAPSSNGGGAVTSYTLTRNGSVIYTGAGTSFGDGGLSPATGYSYTVLATNSVGNGPTASASASTSAGVPSAPSISLTFQGLTGVYGGETGDDYLGTASYYTINISHGSNNGSAVQYTVIQNSGDNVNWYGLDTVYPPNNNSYQYVIGDYGYGPYYYRVYDVNGIGAGAISNVVSA